MRTINRIQGNATDALVKKRERNYGNMEILQTGKWSRETGNPIYTPPSLSTLGAVLAIVSSCVYATGQRAWKEMGLGGSLGGRFELGGHKSSVHIVYLYE